MFETDIHQFLLEESEKGKLIMEFTSEMESPRYQEFFSQFDENSVKQFIQSYAARKTQYLQYAPQYMEEQEQNISDELTDAMELIWEIQQKKLFNIQCLWRAEKIHLPGIETTFHFKYWEKNISECTFVDDVTQEEINLYIEYINSDFFSETNPLDSWQDYEGFSKEHNEEGFTPIPAWFTFYDNHMGTHELMNLPDIRGEKEKRYLRPEPVISYKDYSGSDDSLLCKPKLDLYNPGVLEDFIRRFESRRMFDYSVVYETELRRRSEQNAIESALDVLKNAGEAVSVDASADWRTALFNAAWKYEKETAEKNIRRAFQEYTLRKQSGISQLPGKWAVQEELFAERLASYKHSIIRGRMDVGEGADFNF